MIKVRIEFSRKIDFEEIRKENRPEPRNRKIMEYDADMVKLNVRLIMSTTESCDQILWITELETDIVNYRAWLI